MGSRWNSLIRESVYRALYHLYGKPRGLRLILMYHSVGANGLPAEEFAWQMGFLREHFKVVPLRSFLSAEQSSPEENIACLTFDDGYADNHEVALPILERHRFSGTFFITTGLLGGTFQASHAAHRMMTAEQVVELDRAGQEIGAHTVTHPKLTRIPLAEVRREIVESKIALEQLLSKPVSSFAYPKGLNNAEVRRCVQEAGFHCAVSVEEGLYHGKADPFALPRIWIPDSVSRSSYTTRLSLATTHWVAMRAKYLALRRTLSF